MTTIHFEDVQQVMIQNRQILEMFPFLWPVDEDGNRIPLEKFQFHTTLADRIPQGWGRVFAKDLFERTRSIVESEGIGLDNYQYLRIGVGGNRISIVGNIKNDKLQSLFDEIEYMSERICADCGMPATYISVLAGIPVCENCKMMIEDKRGGKSGEFVRYEPTVWIKVVDGKQLSFDGKNWIEQDGSEEKDDK